MKKYEAIRIPKFAYDSLPIVKAKAIQNQAAFPRELLAPQECPLCHKPLEKTMDGYVKCENCGYGQPTINLSKADIGPELADLGKGALLALCVASLAYLVGQEEYKGGGRRG